MRVPFRRPRSLTVWIAAFVVSRAPTDPGLGSFAGVARDRHGSSSMRRTFFLATLVVAATLACREGPTAPPSGLAATISVTGAYPPLAPPTVQAAGDSVVATYGSGLRCDGYHADAGLRGGMLVITVTDMAQVQSCLLVTSFAVYRVVVHGAPSGRYFVVVASRTVQPDGSSSPISSIGGEVVTLP